MEFTYLEFYAVRNQEGKWFRAKGYGGYGDTWVSDIKKARTYNKLGSARAQVSYFANNYPKYGIPELVVFKCDHMEVLDETERVEKQRQKKELAEKNRELRNKKYFLEKATREFEEAKKKLESFKE